MSKGDKMAKWGSILGYAAVGILLLNIVLTIGANFIPAVGCLFCLIWPVLIFGFFAALVAIVFGIIALVQGTSPNMKSKAILALGLGGGYFIIGIVWRIISAIIF